VVVVVIRRKESLTGWFSSWQARHALRRRLVTLVMEDEAAVAEAVVVAVGEVEEEAEEEGEEEGEDGEGGEEGEEGEEEE